MKQVCLLYTHVDNVVEITETPRESKRPSLNETHAAYVAELAT